MYNGQQTRIVLIISLLLGFVIRMVYILKFAPKDINIPSGDALGYHILAINIISYGQFGYEKNKPTAHREPLYPLFLAFVYKFVGDNLLIVRTLQAVINIISICLIYFISKELFNESVALISSVLASFWPSFIYYSATVLREIFFTFLLLLTIFALIKNVKDNKLMIKQIFLGTLCALLALTNSIGIVLFLGVIIYFLKIKFPLKKIFLVAVSFLFLYSFWVYRNYKIFGVLVLGSTNGGKTFWDGTDIIPFEVRGLPQEEIFAQKTEDYAVGMTIYDEVERDRFFYKKALEYYRKNPSKIFTLAIKRFIKFWKFLPHKGRFYGVNEKIMFLVATIYIPVFVLFILGLILFFKKDLNYVSFLVLLPIICFCIIYSIFWSQIRYRIPIEPYVIILSSYGFNEVLNLTMKFCTR